MQITQSYIPISTKRRSGQKLLGAKFIVPHDTGNPGSTAEQNVRYYINSANDLEASAHAFVDDKGVIECIPETEKAWHVRYSETLDNSLFGGDANDWALGIELCFGGTIDNKKAYDNYVEYIASKLKKYSLTSAKVAGHFQLDPSRRRDPMDAFKMIGKTWDGFKKDLELALALLSPSQPAAPVTEREQLKEQIGTHLNQAASLLKKL